jgi:phospholipid/cholesterol/gamma-HCH transport system substrate-binding protein
MARVLQDETVPRLNSLADGLSRQTRSLDRVIRTLGEHPQSLVFGTAPARAGPGEAGFRAGGEQ